MSFGSSGRVEVVNRQRGCEIDCRRWASFAGEALAAIRRVEEENDSSFVGATVAFVGDRTIRRLNREFLGKDVVTDVLSFPREPEKFEPAEARSLGDVIISLPQAARQAAENKLTLDAEIAQLILHGLLHLCGYDHATDSGEMNKLELRLRRRLAIG